MKRPARADRLRALGLLLLASLGLAVCGQAPDARPGVVIVSFDTTRYDHTSLAGYARDTTPNLAKLAAEGASFAAAYAPTSTTGPSHASLFTGQTPLLHGVTKNGVPLPAAAHPLAEVLRGSGYATGAFVSSFVLSRRFAFDAGFDTFDDSFDRATSTFEEKYWEGKELEGGFDRRADETTRRAVAWLEKHARKGPFFLFVHYFDPHAPYVPPAAFAGKFPPDAGADDLARTIARYDEEISFTDAALGDLLAALDRIGRKRDSLVVVTADHGEGLMEHGHMEHGISVYEEQVRVPLVMRFPGRIAAGKTYDVPVSLVDVVPTLAELLPFFHPDALFDGQSFAHAVTAGVPPEAWPIFLYRRHFAGEKRGDHFVVGEKFGVREGRWKYVDGPEEKTRELYDLEADPRELANRLAPAPAPVPADVRTPVDVGVGRIAAWRRSRTGPGDGKLAITPEERLRLEALGYTE